MSSLRWENNSEENNGSYFIILTSRKKNVSLLFCSDLFVLYIASLVQSISVPLNPLYSQLINTSQTKPHTHPHQFTTLITHFNPSSDCAVLHFVQFTHQIPQILLKIKNLITVFLIKCLKKFSLCNIIHYILQGTFVLESAVALLYHKNKQGKVFLKLKNALKREMVTVEVVVLLGCK